jgi:hypothetical protein
MSSLRPGGPKSQEWHRILRHFYKIHPPPEDWEADEWDDAAWRDKIDRIIATYQKKAAKAAQKTASSASPGGRVAAARAAFQSLEAGVTTWEELLCAAYREQKGVDPKIVYRARHRKRPTRPAKPTLGLQAPPPAPALAPAPAPAPSPITLIPAQAPAPSQQAAATTTAPDAVAETTQAPPEPQTEAQIVPGTSAEKLTAPESPEPQPQPQPAPTEKLMADEDDDVEDMDQPVPVPPILPSFTHGYGATVMHGCAITSELCRAVVLSMAVSVNGDVPGRAYVRGVCVCVCVAAVSRVCCTRSHRSGGLMESGYTASTYRCR